MSACFKFEIQIKSLWLFVNFIIIAVHPERTQGMKEIFPLLQEKQSDLYTSFFSEALLDSLSMHKKNQISFLPSI